MKTRATVSSTRRLIDRDDAIAIGLSDEDLQPVPGSRLKNLREVLVDDTWFAKPIDDQWKVAFKIVPQDGAPIVAEVRLFPAEQREGRSPGEWSGEYLGRRSAVPRGGITARLVHSLRVGEYLREGRKAVEYASRQGARVLLERHGITTLEPAKSRRGPKGRPDRFYADIAAEYVEAWKAGSASPAADVAKRRRLPRSQVRDMLTAARRRGLLSQATLPGRAGAAELTEKALAVLAAPKARTVRRRA